MKVIDGCTLSAEYRKLLRPGEEWKDGEGVARRLPRFYYVVESWKEAGATVLTDHFTLAELISVDCREAPLLLREFPHFIPSGVVVLARYLEAFRRKIDEPVFVSVNGGYRSPAHQRQRVASPHAWACGADIYRIGNSWMDSSKNVERYARLAESLGPEVRVKRFGHESGETDDHLHFDIGYVNLEPHQWTSAE